MSHTPRPCNPWTKTARIWNNAVRRLHGCVRSVISCSSPSIPNFQVSWGKCLYTETYDDFPYRNSDSYIILSLWDHPHICQNYGDRLFLLKWQGPPEAGTKDKQRHLGTEKTDREERLPWGKLDTKGGPTSAQHSWGHETAAPREVGILVGSL